MLRWYMRGSPSRLESLFLKMPERTGFSGNQGLPRRTAERVGPTA
jgi:hypothetical protein